MTAGVDSSAVPAGALGLVSLLLCMAFPWEAAAGTVAVVEGGDPEEGQPTQVLEFEAAPGESNDVLIVLRRSTGTPPSDTMIRVVDTGNPVTPGENCVAASGGAVDCSASAIGLAGAIVRLGDGADRVRVRNTRLRVLAGRGDDVVVGGPFEEFVVGGPGNDKISLGSGEDHARAGSGADVVRGGPGGDSLTGGSGRDRLIGGTGRDDIRARDRASDSVLGGRGRDRAFVDAALDAVSSIERIIG